MIKRLREWISRHECDIIIVMLMVFGAAVVCFLAAHCSYVWVRPLN